MIKLCFQQLTQPLIVQFVAFRDENNGRFAPAFFSFLSVEAAGGNLPDNQKRAQRRNQ